MIARFETASQDGHNKKEFSMKNVFKMIGIIAITAVIGISCTTSDGGVKNTDPKTLIITGVTGTTGNQFTILVAGADGKAVAGAQRVTISETMNIQLYKPGPAGEFSLPAYGGWTGTGEYFITLNEASAGTAYFQSYSSTMIKFEDTETTVDWSVFKKR